jgi:cupin superfamily acireductone dioxygenase involved in methionine salvage
MKLFETYDTKGIGYDKLFHFESWRVARLNYIDELSIQKLNFIECHQETDEVFVLLEGKCDMVLLKEEHPKTFIHLPLEKKRIYKIPKGVYHAHALSKDAEVLIIEEENTSDDNSHRIYLNDHEMQQIQSLIKGASHEL